MPRKGMKVPTLGYEDDTTLSKCDVARLQIEEAITLFVACKFLPAITLAGAAEEIFGRLLQRGGNLSAVKETTKHIRTLRVETGLEVMGTKTEKELIDDWNAVRNTLKHLIGPEDEPITLNLCDEAYWMIRRALANAQALEVQVGNAQDFENWVITNVNM